jgi:hypothetical protein
VKALRNQGEPRGAAPYDIIAALPVGADPTARGVKVGVRLPVTGPVSGRECLRAATLEAEGLGFDAAFTGPRPERVLAG